MKNRFIYLLVSLLTIISVSCYDDKGNYDYLEVNEIKVDIEKNYSVRKLDTVFVIRPVVTQSQGKSMDNLSFKWTYNTFSDQTVGVVVSKADTVGVVINPSDPKFSYDHFLRLYIRDTLTGAEYLFPVKLNVIKPYEGAWMVLHADHEGTKLGSVEYIGENMEVCDDAFFKERNRRLKGQPSRLGVVTNFNSYSNPRYSPTCLLYCFTDDPEESGALMQDAGFQMYDSVVRFVFPGHLADFKSSDVKNCEGEGRGRICVSNGNLFQGSNYYTKTYKVRQAAQVKGEMNITHATSAGWTFLAFDSKEHRFLHFYNANGSGSSTYVFDEPGENTSELDYIKKDPQNVAGINLDKIDEKQEMAYFGSGYWYGPSMMASQGRMAAYAVTINKDLGYTYVYEFHGCAMWRNSEDDYPFTYFASFPTPSGMNAETPMASSSAFNRLIFYAVGNKVYRLDFGAQGGNTTLIYMHPDPSAKAVAMEFARKDVGGSTSYDQIYPAYGHDVFRSLGIAFEKSGGSGDLVVLNLSNAGKIDKNGTYPSEQVHEGFGKIKDIKFI